MDLPDHSELWDAAIAARYDEEDAAMFADDVLGPTVDFLVARAAGGAALELAIGTGRVGVALHGRGVPVSGIELSEPMAGRLRAKTDEIPVVIGDMSAVRVPGEFALVYLVYNTITNLLTQDAQVACFENAARHLAPGGAFVIECGVPALRRLPPGEEAAPFDVSDDHVGIDTFDVAAQLLVSHHLTRLPDGTYRRGSSRHRFAWPGEMDLMARIAGMSLAERYADWRGTPYTSESTGHVSVWRRPLS